MELVESWGDINNNCLLFSAYLNQSQGRYLAFAKKLIKRGRCFVVAGSEGQLQFVPSKFVGYQLNSAETYEQTTGPRDGRNSNDAISKIVGFPAEKNEFLEKSFLAFAASLGVEPDRQVRRYWRLAESAIIAPPKRNETLMPYDAGLQWCDWLPFPDPRKGMLLTAPFGPGVYQLRNAKTGELILFGKGKNCAARMTSLLPAPHGSGTRNNGGKRSHVLENLQYIEYRCLPCKTDKEAIKEERKLKQSPHKFPT